ncbi:MAG: RHS repeat-associated core domain-containing protein [Isosphaerales bacterium]
MNKGSLTLDGDYTGSGGGQVIFGAGFSPMSVAQNADTTFDFPAGMFQWQSGTIQVGSQVFTNAGVITGGGTLTGTLTNTGTIELPSGLVLDNGTIQNTSTGLIDFPANTRIDSNGTDAIDNAGTIRKSGGDGASNIGAPLNNAATGVLQVETGTISLLGGGDFQGGNFLTDPFTSIGIESPENNGKLVLDGTYTGSGGGEVVLGAPIQVAQSADTTFHFPAGMLIWNTGTIQAGSHNFTNAGGFTVGTWGLYPPVLTGTLQNTGTLNLIDSFTLSAGTLDNLSTGTVVEVPDPLNSITTTTVGLNSASQIDNSGQFTMTDTSSWTLDHGSTVVNETGGTMSVGPGLSVSSSDPASLFTNKGTLTFTSSNGVSDITVPFDDQGTVDVSAGRVNFNTSVAQISGGALTGGTWIAAGGARVYLPALFATNQADVTIDGATSQIFERAPGTPATWLPFAPATNAGTIHLLDGASLRTTQTTNAGRIELGTTSSIVLSQGGTFTQTAAGTLAIDIGGSPASGLLGKLIDDPASTAAATVNLGGTLELDVVGGYGPVTGQAYPIVALHDGQVVGDFAKVTGPTVGTQPVFSETQNAASVTVTVAASAADLAAGTITAPATAYEGQPVTITFGVTDQSGVASEGTWVDSVYLASGTTLNGTAVLLGRLNDPGGIGPGQTVTRSLTARVPGITGSEHVIVVVDSQDTTFDPNRANNTAASSSAITISVPVLTLGTPITGSIAAGEDLFYRLNVPPGTTVNLAADLGAGDSAQLFTRYAAQPTPSTYDQTSGNGASPNQDIILSQSQTGPEYILLHALPGAGAAGTSFTLTATAVPFSLLSVSPSQGANVGSVTLDLTGSQFTTATTATLIGPGGARATATTSLESGTSLAATFNLTGLRAGSYAVQVADAGQTTSLPGAFQVVAGQASQAGNVVFLMNVTYPLRPYQTGTLWVNYTNVGQTDAPAPLFEISSDNARFLPPGETTGTYIPDQILLLGLNPDPNGPAGVLPPGASGSYSITFIPKTFGPDVSSSFVLSAVSGTPSTLTNDWSSLLAADQPPLLANATWSTILQNFGTLAGTNTQQFQATLDADATALAQNGQRVSRVDQLIAYELSLTGDQIIQRDYAGTMGPGVNDSQNIRVVPTDSSLQTLALESGSQTSFYQLDPATGIYQGAPGDPTTLTLTTKFVPGGSGVYTVTMNVQAHDADGTIQNFSSTIEVFATDLSQLGPGVFAGVPAPIQTNIDRNGNTTTYDYGRSGALQSVTDAFGNTQTYTYNTQNLVSSITDSSGTTFLTYDGTTKNLLKLITPSGTYQYQYVQSTNPALQNAVSAVIYPDGVQESFTYDAFGRVLTDQLGTESPTTYSYSPSGAVTETDGDGVKTTLTPNLYGEIGSFADALGNVISFISSPATGLSQATGTGGRTILRTQDALGDTTQLVQPDGSTINFSYQTGTTNLTQVTDPDGNTTSFTDNAHGNPTTETNASGQVESFSYDSAGNLVTFVDQMGQTFKNTYNIQGLLISQDRPDGTSVSYSYNSQQLLTGVTDATGTTSFTYDAAGDLTEVEYPDGKSITYSYNAAEQRTRMATSDGYAVRYLYNPNANGQLSALTDDSGNLIAAYQYDSAGRLSRQDNANGTATTYQYNAEGQAAQITNLGPDGNVISSYAYVYNSEGQEIQVTSAGGVTSFTYDVLGQLASVALPGGQTITYQYDSAGNRISMTNNGTTTTYTTNDLNQYVSAGTTTFQYDADGRLIGETGSSGTTTFTYNDLGQMTGQSGPGGTITYQYDALGDLIATTQNGQTTSALVDPTGLGNIIAQYSGSGQVVAQYTYGLALTSRIDPMLGQSFYSFDAGGNTTQLTGANGAVQDSYSYLPFGEKLQSTGSVANPFTYNGQFGVTDLGGGLYSMRNRVYDSALGRFTSMDPLGLGGGDVNLYRFVGNAPLRNVDPSGLQEPTSDSSLSDIAAGLANTVLGTALGGTTLAALYDASSVASTAAQAYQTGSTGLATLQAGRAYTLNSAARTAALQARGTIASNAERALAGRAAALTANVGGKFLPLYGFIIVGLLRQTSVLGGYTNLGDLAVSRVFSGVDDPFSENFDPRLRSTLQDLVNKRTVQHVAGDPNDIVGPAGYGSPGFIQPGGEFPYHIDFENKPTATAPAAQVVVTDQLDPNLNWSTFQLGTIHFNTYTVTVPAGRTFYQTRVDATATLGVYVDVTASFNFQTGLATWTLTAIDPKTLDIETSATLGLLPPDDSTGRGEGYVEYSVQPKPGLAAGTRINAQATIVFDTNAPISTAPIYNTIDLGVPTSTVLALPAVTNTASFTVSWTAADNPGGSGIAGVDIYVSDDGGPFVPFLQDSTATSTVFTGQVGHTYGFYSVATSNIGLVQPAPSAAQATIAVVALPPPVTMTRVHEVLNKKHQVTEVLITFSGAVNSAEAGKTGIYRLATPGKHGSYTAKNAGIIKLKKAAYTAANDTVALTPKKAFALTKPVQLVVNENPPSGLQDTLGRFLDGGRSAVAILTKGKVTIDAVAKVPAGVRLALKPSAVDVVLERGETLRSRHFAGRARSIRA